MLQKYHTKNLVSFSYLLGCVHLREDLKEREWMSLSGFESILCVIFLRDLEVIVSRFGSKFCERFLNHFNPKKTQIHDLILIKIAT